MSQDLFFLGGGGGETGAFVHDYGWHCHPLGAPHAWPDALKTALGVIYAARQPAMVLWGSEQFCFFNDAAMRLSPDTLSIEHIGHPLQAHFAGEDRVPLYEADGHVGGVLCHLADSAAQHRQTKAVDSVLESMTDAFVSVDAHWTILQVNAQHVRNTLIPRHQQIGKSFLDLFLSMPGAQQSRYWLNYHRAMRERAFLSFSDYYEPLDLWTECHVYPTEEGGLAIFVRNIGAQKRAEQRLEAERQKFEAIFINSPAAMAVLRGDQFIFERVNACYFKLLGGRPLEGIPLLEAQPEIENQPFMALLERVLTTGVSYVAHEMAADLVTERGGGLKRRYFDFTYSRLDTTDGAPYGVYIHASDVTERLLARKALVESIHARDELMSVCSHELKTPVASMKLATQMFARRLARKDARATAPEDVARMVNQFDRQLDKLVRLIDEMLDFSRINSGKLKICRDDCNLTGLVADTIERMQQIIVASKTTANFRASGIVRGYWDEFRLEQLFTNLLTNALKYGASTPISVSVDQRDDNAILMVRDEGPGISGSDLRRIFDPYERAASVNSIGGLGLGLYISREIVHAHGGRIEVDSAPNQGAQFTITLPLRPPADELARPASRD